MTAFFGLFIFLAIFNAVNARTYRINTFANLLKNRVFIFIILFVAIVQIILIYYGGDIFRTTGLTIYEFEIIFKLADKYEQMVEELGVKNNLFEEELLYIKEEYRKLLKNNNQ